MINLSINIITIPGGNIRILKEIGGYTIPFREWGGGGGDQLPRNIKFAGTLKH